jgi:hypothetical protein
MRYLIAIMMLAAFCAAPATTADAAGHCPGKPGGKCPAKRTISKNRSDFSESQREKLMESARAICKKRYGSTSRVYKLDYKKWTVICTE